MVRRGARPCWLNSLMLWDGWYGLNCNPDVAPGVPGIDPLCCLADRNVHHHQPVPEKSAFRHVAAGGADASPQSMETPFMREPFDKPLVSFLRCDFQDGV